MAELKLDTKYIDEAIQNAVNDIKQNYIPLSVIEDIREEIMQLYNEVEVVDYDHNDVFRIKKAHWITREEVLQIIDRKIRGVEVTK